MGYRKVDGVFWTDPKVRPLTEQERYLFLYCITCPSAHSSGIYYNPLPMVSYETGISDKGLLKAFGSLREGFMVFRGSLSGVIFVRNMLKFQQPNKYEKESIAKHLKTIQDKELLLMFLDTYPEYMQAFGKDMGSLREAFGKDIDTNTKTNTETDTKTETIGKPSKKQNKNSFGLKGLVKMTDEEYQKLQEKYGKEKTDDKILRLEANKNFKDYTDHYLTLNNWLRDEKTTGKVDFNNLFGD
jgi:hypothetical protein